MRDRFLIALNNDEAVGSVAILAVEGCNSSDLYDCVENVGEFVDLMDLPTHGGLWVGDIESIDWPQKEPLPLSVSVSWRRLYVHELKDLQIGKPPFGDRCFKDLNL